MKLLLDANLSWRMISLLEQHFSACFHVDQLPALSVPAKDSEIWNYAREHDLIIVTNDEDYVDLINLKGFPPKVVLLRVGNQSSIFVANLLILRKDDIKILLASTESGLLEVISKT